MGGCGGWGGCHTNNADINAANALTIEMTAAVQASLFASR
jgi:hypothetical protein